MTFWATFYQYKRKDAIYQCQKCDVALRISPYFEIYNTNKDSLKVPIKLALLFEKALSHESNC